MECYIYFEHLMLNIGVFTNKFYNIPILRQAFSLKITCKVLKISYINLLSALKSPAAYFEQIQKLERARTGDFLNKKMLDRPERDLLIQKHILEGERKLLIFKNKIIII